MNEKDKLYQKKYCAEHKDQKRAWNIARRDKTGWKPRIVRGIKRKFISTENLYCVVTEKSATPERVEFALQHLAEKGYNPVCRKIEGKYYVLRLFSTEELNDIEFVNVFGAIVEENCGEYFFITPPNGGNENVTMPADN